MSEIPSCLEVSLEPASGDFKVYLKDKLEKYYSFICKYNVDDKITYEIIKLNDFINSSIRSYYEGKVTESSLILFEYFEKNKIEKWLFTENITVNSEFYRSRYSPLRSNEKFDRKDLFHINFKDRHKAASARFSVPGLPALYLGENSYVCHKESESHIEELWFSKFTNRSVLVVLSLLKPSDFNLLLKRADKGESISDELVRKYIVTYPLMMAASVKRSFKGEYFKPEYIIPQVLSQYLVSSGNDKINGIKFPSTKISHGEIVDKNHLNKSYNYYFPVRGIKPVGYCDYISSLFDISIPVNNELIGNIIYDDKMFKGLIATDSFHKDCGRLIKINNEIECKFSRSVYGTIEAYVEEELELRSIN
ncbi:MAG: hypothetical protein WEA36_08480 [Balneolaceae bacterium]